MRRFSTIISLLIAGMFSIPAVAAPRVASLDYCADQYILTFADRKQIAGLSVDAESERSNLRMAARGLPQIPDRLEAVLAVRPDVVVRAWGGGLGLKQALARFGVAVVDLGYADGLAAVRANMRQVAAAVGHQERAETLIADMETRLAALASRTASLPVERRPSAIYMTPGGATSGPDTLVHEIMTAAGVRNHAAAGSALGWTAIDLETLVVDPPDAVVASFFDLRFLKTDMWRLGRHRAVQDFLSSRPVVYVPARKFACATWYVVDAAEQIFRELVAPRMLAAEGNG